MGWTPSSPAWAPAGHISGVGAGAESEVPAWLKVFAVGPTLSPVISGGAPAPHPIQGIGAGFIPANLKTELLDGGSRWTLNRPGEYARRCAAQGGILVGISSGATWPPSPRNYPNCLQAAGCWASTTTRASATCRSKAFCRLIAPPVASGQHHLHPARLGARRGGRGSRLVRHETARAAVGRVAPGAFRTCVVSYTTWPVTLSRRARLTSRWYHGVLCSHGLGHDRRWPRPQPLRLGPYHHESFQSTWSSPTRTPAASVKCACASSRRRPTLLQRGFSHAPPLAPGAAPGPAAKASVQTGTWAVRWRSQGRKSLYIRGRVRTVAQPASNTATPKPSTCRIMIVPPAVHIPIVCSPTAQGQAVSSAPCLITTSPVTHDSLDRTQTTTVGLARRIPPPRSRCPSETEADRGPVAHPVAAARPGRTRAAPERQATSTDLQVFGRSFDARKADIMAVSHRGRPWPTPRGSAAAAAPGHAGAYRPHTDMAYHLVTRPGRLWPAARPASGGGGLACGMFAALLLAQMGLKPIVIERGPPCANAPRTPGGLWRRKTLNPEGNVQFGEGAQARFPTANFCARSKTRAFWGAGVARTGGFGAPSDILFSPPHRHLQAGEGGGEFARAGPRLGG